MLAAHSKKMLVIHNMFTLNFLKTAAVQYSSCTLGALLPTYK